MPTVLGTGKVASLAGTAISAGHYLRGQAGVQIRWRTVAAAAAAGCFALLGARALSSLSKELVKPLVLALLVLMATYTTWRKDFGSLHALRRSADGNGAGGDPRVLRQLFRTGQRQLVAICVCRAIWL